jgi:hypothetical protein
MSRLESIKWHPTATIHKYSPEVVAELTHLLGYEPSHEDFVRLGADPFAITEVDGNLLVTEGIGNLTGLVMGTVTVPVINATRGFIGVGDSSTAAAVTDTALVAATNKFYQKIGSISQTTTTITNDTITAITTVATTDANFAWAEWVIGSTTGGTVTTGTTEGAGGTGAFIFNRRVASMGTKASGASWTFTANIKFS